MIATDEGTITMEELLRDWDARFRNTYGALHPRIKDLLEAFLRCGDLHFGFVRVRCANPDCPNKDEKIVAFSCKTRRLCPTRPPRCQLKG